MRPDSNPCRDANLSVVCLKWLPADRTLPTDLKRPLHWFRQLADCCPLTSARSGLARLTVGWGRSSGSDREDASSRPSLVHVL